MYIEITFSNITQPVGKMYNDRSIRIIDLPLIVGLVS